MKPNPTTPAARETGWLPDCVYTGDKFESGLAFFADGLGRITRFSREPADLAAAKRLGGQAALPGLVNSHSQCLHRVQRGRSVPPANAARGMSQLDGEDIYDAARMAFMEMMLSGITCVGEFHTLRHKADGTPWPDANFYAQEILRAARDLGIRIALHNVACARAGFRQPADALIARCVTPTADQFIRETEALRAHVAREHPGDEAWLGVGVAGLGAVSLDYLKALAEYAHSQRYRLHVPLSQTKAENEACLAEHGRTPVALLAERGLIDKRFTAIHANHVTDDEVKLLGAARAIVCACPTSERARGEAPAPAEKFLATSAAVSLGTENNTQIDLLEDARQLELQLRVAHQRRTVLAPETTMATTLLQAATATGARSLGSSSGALEVGRPADFFTVNLYDPSIVGAEPDAVLDNILFALERRAIRDVWIGARLRIANGRHLQHGPVVGRFVEVQKRLWRQ